MIQEYYRQMRKFGCNILAVIQQYDIIKESAVRGAMIGNSKILPKLNSGPKKFEDQLTNGLHNPEVSVRRARPKHFFFPRAGHRSGG